MRGFWRWSGRSKGDVGAAPAGVPKNGRYLRFREKVTLMIARTFMYVKVEDYQKAVFFADQVAALSQEFPRGYRVPASFSGNVDIRATASNPVAAPEIH